MVNSTPKIVGPITDQSASAVANVFVVRLHHLFDMLVKLLYPQGRKIVRFRWYEEVLAGRNGRLRDDIEVRGAVDQHEVVLIGVQRLQSLA